MAEAGKLYALLAEFAEPDRLIEGACALRSDGWEVETYTPFPLDGLQDAIGFRGRAVGRAAALGGVAGLAIGFVVQAGANLDYPLDVGGRPLVSPTGFGLVTLEIGVLFAVFAAIGTMLIGNRLPRLHHPVFDAERFALASDDRFFLAILAPTGDTPFDVYEARAALWRLQPVDVCEVGTGEAA